MTGALGAAAAVFVVALPLALAAGLVSRALRPAIVRLAPWTAAPALALGLGASRTATFHSDLFVFGTSLGMGDAVSRGFLVLAASVWLASGAFARTYLAGDPRRARFWGFFLAAEGGNLGVALAGDVATFYALFALMTYASYGLVVHEQSAEAVRAGRVYLVIALIGEMLLVVALLIIVGTAIDLPLGEAARVVARSPHRDLIAALLLVGFGVKVGAIVLHVWLPLAHPVAPTPASAVLSGAMIKAGLLGWLRFLPLGAAALPGPGLACVIAGFAAAFYGVIVGLTQPRPKTILAYSSISQMGFVTAALGIALASPAAGRLAIPTVLFFAIHHAFAKGALFLGTGVAGETGRGWPRVLVMLGLAWPALEVAGAPLSSGALAKISLKSVMAASPWHPGALAVLLSLGAIGSTLLLAHFLVRVVPREGGARPRPGLWLPWLLLLALDLVLFALPPVDRRDLEVLVRPANVAAALWPVLAGGALFALARLLRSRGLRAEGRIPAGDLVVVYERAARALRDGGAAISRARGRAGAALRARAGAWVSPARVRSALVRSSVASERSLASFAATGLVLLLALAIGFWLAWRAG